MVVVDAMGLACPMPVVKAKKAIEELTEGGEVCVKVDNTTAVENLTKLAKSLGITSDKKEISDKEYHVIMVVPKGGVEKQAGGNGYVAVISSNVMGGGDDKLGGNLMKAFVFALTQQDVLPTAVLCYNGGVKLACEGSESIEDLKTLADNGVEIVSCGTCLDFYGLKEKLAVGGVTNMYDIVERQAKAGTVIRP